MRGAGYDGAKRRKGSKVHIAVDTLGHLLALTVTPADQGDREQVAVLAKVQQVTGGTVDWSMWTRVTPARTLPTPPNSTACGSKWSSIPMAKRGFVLLPRRWVVERSFA